LEGAPAMKMDKFRRVIETTQFPVLLRVDGKEIAVNSRDNLMLPNAGSLACVYLDGAFEIIDCKHISVVRRDKSSLK
jgi:hypothetical protein